MSNSSESSKSATLRVNMVSESEFTVQGHGVHTAYVEMVSALKSEPGFEVFCNTKMRDTDIVHTHTVGFFALRRLLFSDGKRVVSAHVVPDSFEGSLKFAKLWRPFAKLWLRFFYNRADLVLAVSDATKSELLELGVKKPIEVLYNSIDLTKYANSSRHRSDARKKLSMDRSDFIVVGSGQVQPRKRVDVFFDMAKKMPETKFVWVGGIPFGRVAAESGKLETMMAKAPKNLLFTGVIPLEDVADYYRAADVFILPSIQETFGLVVVEAAAAGLPVILRDIPDYAKTFRGDVLMAKNDEDFMRLVSELKTDKKLASQYQKKSKQLAGRFDARVLTGKLVDLYRGIV